MLISPSEKQKFSQLPALVPPLDTQTTSVVHWHCETWVFFDILQVFSTLLKRLHTINNFNEMIFPLVPKLPKHQWYQGYFYTLHVHVVLHCILHCPTSCSIWCRSWYSWAVTLHICRLPCTCHHICLYDTVKNRGLLAGKQTSFPNLWTYETTFSFDPSCIVHNPCCEVINSWLLPWLKLWQIYSLCSITCSCLEINGKTK